MTPTIILVLVVLNLVLLVLGLTAWRLFRSDPNPTVSDSLGVPRVARVSGIVGTLGEDAGRGRAGSVKSVAAATSIQTGAPNFASKTAPSRADLDLPGLFAVDTGMPDATASAVAG